MWHFLFLRKGVTGHMEKLVKVAVDAMGGDHAPGEVVKGAVDAVNRKKQSESISCRKSTKDS